MFVLKQPLIRYSLVLSLPISTTITFSFFVSQQWPDLKKQDLLVIAEKSPCFMLHFKCSILPLKVSFWRIWTISLQHRYSKAPIKFSFAHSPHVHLQHKQIVWSKIFECKANITSRRFKVAAAGTNHSSTVTSCSNLAQLRSRRLCGLMAPLRKVGQWQQLAPRPKSFHLTSFRLTWNLIGT